MNQIVKDMGERYVFNKGGLTKVAIHHRSLEPELEGSHLTEIEVYVVDVTDRGVTFYAPASRSEKWIGQSESVDFLPWHMIYYVSRSIM